MKSIAKNTDYVENQTLLQEVEEKYKIQIREDVANEVIYIGRKKKRWDGNVLLHTVREGETLWSLGQSYGIRTKSLARPLDVARRGLALAHVAAQGLGPALHAGHDLIDLVRHLCVYRPALQNVLRAQEFRSLAEHHGSAQVHQLIRHVIRRWLSFFVWLFCWYCWWDIIFCISATV